MDAKLSKCPFLKTSAASVDPKQKSCVYTNHRFGGHFFYRAIARVFMTRVIALLVYMLSNVRKSDVTLFPLLSPSKKLDDSGGF
jgi:hypothetical protein